MQEGRAIRLPRMVGGQPRCLPSVTCQAGEVEEVVNQVGTRFRGTDGGGRGRHTPKSSSTTASSAASMISWSELCDSHSVLPVTQNRRHGCIWCESAQVRRGDALRVQVPRTIPRPGRGGPVPAAACQRLRESANSEAGFQPFLASDTFHVSLQANLNCFEITAIASTSYFIPSSTPLPSPPLPSPLSSTRTDTQKTPREV